MKGGNEGTTLLPSSKLKNESLLANTLCPFAEIPQTNQKVNDFSFTTTSHSHMLTIPGEDEPEESYHFPINYGISGWEPKHIFDTLNSLNMMTDNDDSVCHTYSDASSWSILTDHLSYTRHPEAKTSSLKFFENFDRQNQ